MNGQHGPNRPTRIEQFYPDAPVACPFCGNALVEGRYHTCRELREAGYRAEPIDRRLGLRLTPAPARLSNWLVAIAAICVLAYLGAYLLNSLGVGCS